MYHGTHESFQRNLIMGGQCTFTIHIGKIEIIGKKSEESEKSEELEKLMKSESSEESEKLEKSELSEESVYAGTLGVHLGVNPCRLYNSTWFYLNACWTDGSICMDKH